MNTRKFAIAARGGALGERHRPTASSHPSARQGTSVYCGAGGRFTFTSLSTMVFRAPWADLRIQFEYKCCSFGVF